MAASTVVFNPAAGAAAPRRGDSKGDAGSRRTASFRCEKASGPRTAVPLLRAGFGSGGFAPSGGLPSAGNPTRLTFCLLVSTSVSRLVLCGGAWLVWLSSPCSTDYTSLGGMPLMVVSVGQGWRDFCPKMSVGFDLISGPFSLTRYNECFK